MKDYVREQGLPHSPGQGGLRRGDGGDRRRVTEGPLPCHRSSPQSCFVKAYPAETTEAFCDGHNAAVAFFGGAPRSILYDNTKLSVARILGDGKRQRTRVFTELQSHYLFEDRFGPGQGPKARSGRPGGTSLEPAPGGAAAGSQGDHRRAPRTGPGSLLASTPGTIRCLDKRPGRVSSLSLVRCRGNDYSVPVAYGHREVLIRCYVDEVVISCGAEVIARHRRSYDSEDLIFDPLHYLPLIEQKIGALDQAAPLAGWNLPEAFITLRRLPRSRRQGRQAEYVQVLRLLPARGGRGCGRRRPAARRNRL